MQKILSHRAIRLNAIAIVIAAAGTITAGTTYPWAFAALWLILATTTTAAIIRATRGAA